MCLLRSAFILVSLLTVELLGTIQKLLSCLRKLVYNLLVAISLELLQALIDLTLGLLLDFIASEFGNHLSLTRQVELFLLSHCLPNAFSEVRESIDWDAIRTLIWEESVSCFHRETIS